VAIIESATRISTSENPEQDFEGEVETGVRIGRNYPPIVGDFFREVK
jgi:hypothetical protein